MNKFTTGDYVVPVRVMRTDDAVVQALGNQVGKVLQVLNIFQSIDLSVFAGKPKGEAWLCMNCTYAFLSFMRGGS